MAVNNLLPSGGSEVPPLRKSEPIDANSVQQLLRPAINTPPSGSGTL
ncbi:MAG: hypothetical protein R3C24_04315 [Cyanobacteriota/Melainabacteria group bacterium]